MNYDVATVRRRRIIPPAMSFFSNPPVTFTGFAVEGGTTVNGSSTTITTTKANSIIVVAPIINSAIVSSITDTAGLTWNFVNRAYATPGAPSDPVELWYAFSPGILTADTITLHFTGSPSFNAIACGAISGMNIVSPLDGSSVILQANPADPLSLTTTNANTIVIGAFRQNANGSPTAGAGFTQIGSAGNFVLLEYKVLTNAQTISVTDGAAGDSNGGIAVAFKG